MVKIKTDTSSTTETTEINTDPNPIVAENSTTQETIQETTQEPDPIEKTPIEKVKAPIKSTEKSVNTQKIAPQVDAILKVYPNCKELYIDAQGGAFPVDTAQVIRKGAKLYKNPHYQS